MSRPELIAPAELFYNDKEAGKYTENSRVKKIQTDMTVRCLELLMFPDESPRLLLDIGCGSGLSGDVLTEYGHAWVGLDISQDMLDIAAERDVSGDLMRGDMGHGFGFRAGVFDGAVSVSALQWLCYTDKKDQRSIKRLEVFFTALYRALRRGARAALQIYPETAQQLEIMTTIAYRCGFSGGLVVDFPNSTKAKKYFLVLIVGKDGGPMPMGKGTPGAKAEASAGMGDEGSDGEDEDDEDEDEPEIRRVAGSSSGLAAGGGAGGEDGQTGVRYESRRAIKKTSRKRKLMGGKSREYILAKKEAGRRRGDEVRPDTKYTGRKRSKFRV